MSNPSARTLLLKLTAPRLRRGLRQWVKNSSLFDLPVSPLVPEQRKIVVLAPHMDDEVLGCGGTIARHVTAGSEVTVIFLTDGRAGGQGIGSPGAPQVIRIRKAEAHNAARLLGIRTVTFLDAEDGRLHQDRQVAARLQEALERERPDIVYLPFFLERHPDHRAANGVLLQATRGAAMSFECRGYEVWTPLYPNRLVNIDASVQLKRQALSCYVSQLAVMDYSHSALGLNAYRAMGLGSHTGQFAEAFHAQSLADYRRLIDAAGIAVD